MVKNFHRVVMVIGKRVREVADGLTVVVYERWVQTVCVRVCKVLTVRYAEPVKVGLSLRGLITYHKCINTPNVRKQ